MSCVIGGGYHSARGGWNSIGRNAPRKPIYAYRSDVSRTPAGQVFVQETAWLDWRRYADLATLRRQVVADLSRFLLGNAERYGITLMEAQRLHLYIGALEKAANAQIEQVVAPKPAGAGGGGVILAPRQRSTDRCAFGG